LASAGGDHDERDQIAGDLTEGLHEEDGGHHPCSVFCRGESRHFSDKTEQRMECTYSEVMTADSG
jgi:hypothetical protein